MARRFLSNNQQKALVRALNDAERDKFALSTDERARVRNKVVSAILNQPDQANFKAVRAATIQRAMRVIQAERAAARAVGVEEEEGWRDIGAVGGGRLRPPQEERQRQQVARAIDDINQMIAEEGGDAADFAISRFLPQAAGAKGVFQVPKDEDQLRNRNQVRGAWNKALFGKTTNMLPIQQAIRSSNSYRLKEGYLSSFPQWASKQAKKSAATKQRLQDMTSKVEEFRDPNSQYLQNLQSLNDNLASWNQEDNRWQGRYVQKMRQKANSLAVALPKRIKSANQTINKRISEAQMLVAVPSIVRQVVAANDSLSTSGFGPIKKNGTGAAALYAGRWIDQTTGRVRILPQADSKYLNPYSLEQKLGYLQAKILNHWNLMLDTYLQYSRLKQKDQTDYKEQMSNSIQRGMNYPGLMISYMNFISRNIQWYYSTQDQTSLKYQLFENIPNLPQIFNRLQGQIPKTASDVTPVMLNQMTDRAKLWEEAILKSQIQLENQYLVSNSKSTPEQTQDFQIKLNRLVLSLIAGPGRSIKNSLLKIQKAAIIPQRMSQRDMLQVVERVDQAKKTTNDKIGNLTLGSATMDAVTNMLTVGDRAAKAITSGDTTGLGQAVYSLAESLRPAGRRFEFKTRKTALTPLKDRVKNIYDQRMKSRQEAAIQAANKKKRKKRRA